MTKELLNEIENDYWNEKADPIDMTEVFDLANRALEQTELNPSYNGVKSELKPCEDCISREALIERINNAEENFKVDNMESIASGDGDPFVDGVLSGVFNIRAMVQQAPSVTPQQKVR